MKRKRLTWNLQLDRIKAVGNVPVSDRERFPDSRDEFGGKEGSALPSGLCHNRLVEPMAILKSLQTVENRKGM